MCSAQEIIFSCLECFELLKTPNCHVDECKIGIRQINVAHSELELQMVMLPSTAAVGNVDFNYCFTLKDITLHKKKSPYLHELQTAELSSVAGAFLEGQRRILCYQPFGT